MSMDHQVDSNEPMVGGSHPIGASGEHPPLEGSHDERPAMISECYWRIFNDPGLSPPDGALADPSPVSSKAFHDLTHQVRILIDMVQSIIPLVSRPSRPSAVQPLWQ